MGIYSVLNMKLGFVGLGRMGNAMVLNLLEKGVDVVAFNRTASKINDLKSEFENSKKVESGELIPAFTVEELVRQLETPRIIWLMIPQGPPVDEMIGKLLLARLVEGDMIIDGGNCFYKDSQRHYTELKAKGINYLDVGTSGGLTGARNGACLMIGGDEESYKKFEPLFKSMACEEGYAYFGPAGAGHFVKMVHNGVEYGMLQALGEGFEVLQKGPFKLDFEKAAHNWSHGSVVRGWLTELLEKAFKSDPKLDEIEGVVGGGTTGRWTTDVAKELGVETPVMVDSIKAREQSQTKPTFAGKVVAALRNQFGGHELKKVKS